MHQIHEVFALLTLLSARSIGMTVALRCLDSPWERTEQSRVPCPVRNAVVKTRLPFPSPDNSFVLKSLADSTVEDHQQRRRFYFPGLPEPYNSLEIGESYCPFPELSPELVVRRLANEPDIFLVKQILALEKERESLMDVSQNHCRMTYAETTLGTSVKRRGSHVSWVNDRPYQESQCFSPSGEQVAHYLATLSASLFLPENICIDRVKRERLQVVRYEVGGAFDLHHDGQMRFLTVLTYLNGVAGTWFPYAGTTRARSKSTRNAYGFTELTHGKDGVEDKLILKHDETPGHHGLLVVGSEHNSKGDAYSFSSESVSNATVVPIQPGDALAFYNYDFFSEEIETDDVLVAPVRNWKAIHSALPASKEKWIATNWFSYEQPNSQEAL